MKPKILLIEDEESLALGLDYNLTEEGYYVVWADNGKSGIEKFLTDNYDLIILDIMLPYLDGFEVAKKIRESDPKMPILILTARANAVDKIKGLEIGADDYITKPFNLDELLLRIKGMLKRILERIQKRNIKRNIKRNAKRKTKGIKLRSEKP